MLPTLTKHLRSCYRQFGFRPGTNCVSTVLVIMKEVNAKYNRVGFLVHCAKVDMAKASDKVRHGQLIKMLWDSLVPERNVDTLEYVCFNTYVDVKVNRATGDPSRIGIDSRQGSVTSPVSLSNYLDDMMSNISNMYVACS